MLDDKDQFNVSDAFMALGLLLVVLSQNKDQAENRYCFETEL